MNHNYICPICESVSFVLLHQTEGGRTAFNKNIASFHICNPCGLVFRYPKPSQTELIGSFYALEYWKPNIPKEQFFKKSKPNSARLKEILSSIGEDLSSSTVIDMGCGTGSMVEALASALPNSRVLGVEPSVGIAAQLEEYNPHKNVQITRGSLETGEFENIKAVFLTTVFEHILDPAAALMRLRSWLAPNGYLVILVPDVMEPGPLGLDYFFRDFHLYYYSDRTLAALLSRFGFGIVKVFRGGVFKTATAPTLCIVARKLGEVSMEPVFDATEAARIKERMKEVRNRTRLSAPLLYAYRFKLRRPLMKAISKIR